MTILRIGVNLAWQNEFTILSCACQEVVPILLPIVGVLSHDGCPDIDQLRPADCDVAKLSVTVAPEGPLIMFGEFPPTIKCVSAVAPVTTVIVAENVAKKLLLPFCTSESSVGSATLLKGTWHADYHTSLISRYRGHRICPGVCVRGDCTGKCHSDLGR